MSDTQKKKPLTPQEQWEAVLLTAAGPEARELDEMSDEELDAELRASGINPERLAREGQARAEQAMRDAGILPPLAEQAPDEESVPAAPVSGPALPKAGDAVAKPRSIPVQAQPAEVLEFRAPARRRRLWPLLLVAAALTASIGTGVVIATRDEPRPPPTPYPEEPPRTHEPPPSQVAGELRHAARIDCEQHEWQRCFDRLDQARYLDPAGETAEDAKLRDEAKDALTPRDGGGLDDKKGK